jgi:hypothetical protein
MKARRWVPCLAAALGIPSLAAAGIVIAGTVTGGNLVTVSEQGTASGATAVAIDAPVTGSGVLDTAYFGWSNSGCTQIRIKVFRPNGSGGYDFVTERGPFAVNSGGPSSLSAVSLSPTIPVEAGDVLGASDTTSGGCGSPEGTVQGFGRTVELSGDVSTSFAPDSTNTTPHFDLALYASGPGAPENFAGVLTGAGSLHGAGSAIFKTGIQLENPYFDTIRGRMIFHPMGATGTLTDPSLGFTLEPGETKSADDIVAALDLSGLWSVDVYTGQGDSTPLVLAHVFSDAGEAGTTGFTESLIDPAHLTGGVSVSATGVLLGPPDLVKYRYQIGVRTLDGPVFVSVTVKDASGTVVHTSSQTFPANSYFQLTVEDFTDGFSLDANDSIVITYSGGRAIFYGAMTDNVTNDPSVQFMPVFFAIA